MVKSGDGGQGYLTEIIGHIEDAVVRIRADQCLQRIVIALLPRIQILAGSRQLGQAADRITLREYVVIAACGANSIEILQIYNLVY